MAEQINASRVPAMNQKPGEAGAGEVCGSRQVQWICGVGGWRGDTFQLATDSIYFLARPPALGMY